MQRLRILIAMKYIIPFDYVTLRPSLVTATRYIKQDLIATGLREIASRMIIIAAA